MTFRPVIAVLALAVCCSVLAQQPKSLPGSSALTIDEEELKFLVELCEGCHGRGGHSDREDVPALAGRPADELFGEIERFYFYERFCPDVPVDDENISEGHMSMCDVVNQLNRPEAEALARYFAEQ